MDGLCAECKFYKRGRCQNPDCDSYGELVWEQMYCEDFVPVKGCNSDYCEVDEDD